MAADEGFHEIQLNGKQLVFLFMAGTVVAVVIFLLGVFVGRGVRAEVGQPIAAEALPVPPPDAPPVAVAPQSGAPATSGEDLSYPNRLATAEPARETLKPAPAAAVPPPPELPPPPAPPAREAVASKVAGEPAGDGYAIQVAALGKREEAEVIVNRLTEKGYSAYLIAPAQGAPAVYRVRVGKFKDRREADSVSARLQKEEQFKPWIVR
jgi:cell division septation protein DedD